MSHYYAKFKENPCVGTDASTPLNKIVVSLQKLLIENHNLAKIYVKRAITQSKYYG